MEALSEPELIHTEQLHFELPAIKRVARIYKKPKKVLDKSYMDYLTENQSHVASILAKYGKVAPRSEFDTLYPPEDLA